MVGVASRSDDMSASWLIISFDLHPTSECTCLRLQRWRMVLVNLWTLERRVIFIVTTMG